MGLAIPRKGQGYELTGFACAIFSKDGYDPYMEDMRTHWLLHWNMATGIYSKVLAWDLLVNYWPHSDITRTEALSAFRRESSRLGHAHSLITLEQHLDIFFRTYYVERKSVSLEDSLDSPLVDLRLLRKMGERRGDQGRWEPVFVFDHGPKPGITDALFAYCVDDYWSRYRQGEATLSFRNIAFGAYGPGQVFKLSQEDIVRRLEIYEFSANNQSFVYTPSALQGMLSRCADHGKDLLVSVYERDA